MPWQRRQFSGRDLTRVLNIADLREVARRRIPHFVFEYVEGGAEDENTLRCNRRAFEASAASSRRRWSTRRRATTRLELFGRPVGRAAGRRAHRHERHDLSARGHRPGACSGQRRHSFLPEHRLHDPPGGRSGRGWRATVDAALRHARSGRRRGHHAARRRRGLRGARVHDGCERVRQP